MPSPQYLLLRPLPNSAMLTVTDYLDSEHLVTGSPTLPVGRLMMECTTHITSIIHGKALTPRFRLHIAPGASEKWLERVIVMDGLSQHGCSLLDQGEGRGDWKLKMGGGSPLAGDERHWSEG